MFPSLSCRRRRALAMLAAAASLCLPHLCIAQGLDALSNLEAASGVRAALERGASLAVDQLGRANGFLANPKVKIELPEGLRQAEAGMRMLGLGQQADQLVTTMNRAAEGAVAQAKPLMLDAVKQMSVTDAKNILTGGDHAVTEFFRSKTQTQLTAKFLPLVREQTGKLGLAQQYNQLAGRAAQFGAVRSEDASVEQYVTRKTIDGLYLMIGEQEKAIRRDPLGTGSQILGKVFGALN